MNASDIYQSWPKAAASIPEQPKTTYIEEECDWEALWSQPIIDPTAWVSPSAAVLGRVRLGGRSSVWYGCVLRGDGARIEVGEETNVQDCSVLHVEPDRSCILEKRVTLGHRATVHSSVIEDGAMIGIGATVLSGCVIGHEALVAAGALVLEGTQVPPGTLWAGVPARQIKELTGGQKERMTSTYKHYVNLGALYLKRFGRAHIDAISRQ